MPTVSRQEFARILYTPFRFFQFFCLTSFDTTLSIKFSLRTILLILTWHICIATILLLHIGYTFYVILPSISNNHFDLYVIIRSLDIVAVLLAQAICIIESFVKRTIQIKFLSNVQCIVSNFSEQLQYIINLKPVHRKFVQNGSTILLISGASCVWTFSTFGISFWPILGPALYSFQLMYVRKIQVGFFVDMIVVLLEELRNVLDDIRNEMNGRRRSQELLVAQRIYGEIVKTVAMVNLTFGLSLVAVIFQNILQLMSTTYWFIIYFYYFQSNLHIFSE